MKDDLRTSHGYRVVRVRSKGRCACKPSANHGYAYHHRLVVAMFGWRLWPRDIVHHCNGDRMDNRVDNLEILTRSEHARLHAATQGRDDKGRFSKENRRERMK